MPKAVEEALDKAASKLGKMGKLKRKKGESLSEAKEHFKFGTMTNMQKKGSIPPWRTLK